MHDLDPLRKKSFVRFLLWVYMNTGSDKIQSGSVLLFHDRYVSYTKHLWYVEYLLCVLLGKCGIIWSI